jgi:tetratricopeptide (TPR) repeat protein
MADRATNKRFHPTLKKILIVFMLALLCTGVVSYKYHLFKKLPFFDKEDGEGFFWTESAFHFRHFLMIAEGKGIPSVDHGIQYPEGLDTVRYITPVMERVTGTLYRLFFSSVPPRLFLPYFSFVFTTLSVLAVFLTGKIVWRSNLAALIVAFFYSLTPASLIRTAGAGFIREKDVYTSLFQSEVEFYELCKRYKADLLVYQISLALEGRPMSIRYLAGAIPLRMDSAAFLLHFAPEKLKLFRLIYQNPFYRVYKVGWQTAPEELDLRYEPIYDLANFLDGEEPGEFISDAVLEGGVAGLRRSDTHRKIGDRFFHSGSYKVARLQYERALALDQQNKMALWGLSKSLLKVGEKARALEVLRAALLLDPSYDATALDIQQADLLLVMGVHELDRKQYDRAENIFKMAIQVKPDSEEAYFGLGETLLRQEKFAEAKVGFQKVISLNVHNHNAYENLARVYTAQGDLEKATIYIKKSLAINPDQPHLYKILDEFRKLMQKR